MSALTDPCPWLSIVIGARYGGVYEGAPFVAFNVDPDFGQVPDEAIGNDTEARRWWDSDEATRVGRGVTPTAALVDLADRWPDDRELQEEVRALRVE